ncbi:MAG: hypothetical protein QM538_05435 [Methylacidiphilales bacterium]|nr:hypothetical protein [Candidatus Methylacidiphilales bacterium]
MISGEEYSEIVLSCDELIKAGELTQALDKFSTLVFYLKEAIDQGYSDKDILLFSAMGTHLSDLLFERGETNEVIKIADLGITLCDKAEVLQEPTCVSIGAGVLRMQRNVTMKLIATMSETESNLLQAQLERATIALQYYDNLYENPIFKLDSSLLDILEHLAGTATIALHLKDHKQISNLLKTLLYPYVRHEKDIDLFTQAEIEALLALLVVYAKVLSFTAISQIDDEDSLLATATLFTVRTANQCLELIQPENKLLALNYFSQIFEIMTQLEMTHVDHALHFQILVIFQNLSNIIEPFSDQELYYTSIVHLSNAIINTTGIKAKTRNDANKYLNIPLALSYHTVLFKYISNKNKSHKQAFAHLIAQQTLLENHK